METTSTCHTDDLSKGIMLAGGSAARTQSSKRELEVLYQISTRISSQLELAEVLDQIIGLVNQVTHGMATPACSICWMRPSKNLCCKPLRTLIRKTLVPSA